ncbi:replicative DNA helicase [Chitinispirillales bacterium ANBcel5]|uniref:replicative DNA helicase n=1 Tax=Cellulosispirillum alkaliphilum TaxID=3039283 RepID=UPI002A5283FF|nr:replicative DNA helicase [Chitinispirillales bacterium ANBcel5]
MPTKNSKPSADKSLLVTDRLPPQALDVEKTILGSMLIDSNAAVLALELLNEEDFYSSANQKIFICMRDLFEKSNPIDIITLADALRKKSWLLEIGEEVYLSELVENITTSGNIEYYSNILKEKAILRQLISVAAEITTECFDNEQEPQSILDSAEAKIFNISESRIKNKFESTGQLLPHTFAEIESYSKGGFKGVPTGFKELDDMTTGLQRGDMVIIAGRPSMGKTAFILSLTLNSAMSAKCPTAIFSLEMSKAQLVQRMLCSEARVNMHALRSGTLPKRDFPKLSLAAGPLSEAPIYIDDTPAITVLELRAKARRLKAQHDLQLIIIDYLQLMGSSSRVESRQQEISQISRALKGVAKELDVPVIALSQLSRAVEQRTGNHRPQLSDLRESGAIEQDADVVMFVYRDEVYNKDDENNKGKAEIIVGKQRNGPIGTANLAFVKDFARFENLSERAEEIPGF